MAIDESGGYAVRRAAGSLMAVFLAGAVLGGCGTIKHGPLQMVPVTTEPAGARVNDNGMDVGITPANLMLQRKNDHTLRLTLDGYDEAQVTLKGKASGWFWTNCCFLGYAPIFMIVDFISGSYYNLVPPEVHVKLLPRKVPLLEKPVNTAGGTGRPALAVADFEAVDVPAGNAVIIGDMFRGEVVRAGGFDVVEKANMQKILAEQAFQQTGCTSQECAVKLGKLLNVRFLAVGSFGKLMDSFVLNMRVVDVETGRIVYSDVSQGKDVETMQAAVREMATKLAREITSP